MRPKLVSLEWEAAAFRADGHRWSVMLTTPRLAPRYIQEIRKGLAMGVCHYEERRIWLDAAFPEQFAETLHHELHHVMSPAGDSDHKFFEKTSPFVVDVYLSWGINLVPELPQGWERLCRSSQHWHRRHEEEG